MGTRTGTWVKGHYRAGSWVGSHFRSGTNYTSTYRGGDYNYGSIRSITSPSITSVTYVTNCYECGQQVYFHRHSNGGCVLFDSLGQPWPVHKCWKDFPNKRRDIGTRVLHNISPFSFVELIDQPKVNPKDILNELPEKAPRTPEIVDDADDLFFVVLLFLAFAGLMYVVIGSELDWPLPNINKN